MASLDTPADVEHMVQTVQITKWCNTSAFVMYLYELLITFDEEVNFIWNGVFSPGKALFLLLRYLTLASLLFHITIMNLGEVSSELFVAFISIFHILIVADSADFLFRCLAWVRFQWIAGSLIGIMAHVTLELRLYAMFNKSKTICALLVVATLSIVGSMFGILIAILRREGSEFLNLGQGADLHMCLKTDIPDLVVMFWIPILVAEALLVGLAILKCLRTHSMSVNDWLSNRPPYGFLRFLVRDSMLFFFMVFASFLGTELVWIFAGDDYIEAPVGFAIASSSIWSQRLLLNIRKHRQPPPDELLVTVSSEIPDFANDSIVLETLRSMRDDRSEVSPRWK